MSHRKCALFSLVVILVGTLALASPDGPGAWSTDDKAAAPDKKAASKDALSSLLQKLTDLLPQIEIEIASAPRRECPACRQAKKIAVDETVELQLDADQPHAPAVLLLGARTAPARPAGGECLTAHDVKVKVAEATDARLIFGTGVNSDCGILGNIVVCEARTQSGNCRGICCDSSEDDEDACPGTCKRPVRIQSVEPDDDDDDDDCDDAVESFISQVLQSQMQYLECMMRVRLQHEKDLMEAKGAAESAHAKQRAEHAEELMKLRLDHMAEILTMQEAVWETERKAMADRHRDALEHERELAELRTKHIEQLQSHRIAALESEVKLLRGQAGSSEPERVAHTPDDVGRQSSATRRPVLVELPIQVENLTSGRVRYSPVPPKPTDQVAATNPHSGLERVELTTPPISTSRPTPTEIERLRREVARLHALIEDLVCIAPEAPPSPKPQSSVEDDDD